MSAAAVDNDLTEEEQKIFLKIMESIDDVTKFVSMLPTEKGFSVTFNFENVTSLENLKEQVNTAESFLNGLKIGADATDAYLKNNNEALETKKRKFN